MLRVECYIKGEERNAEKKAKDVKERGNVGGDRRNYYPPPRDRRAFIRQERMTYKLDNFTSLNTRLERIYKEVYQSSSSSIHLNLRVIAWEMI